MYINYLNVECKKINHKTLFLHLFIQTKKNEHVTFITGEMLVASCFSTKVSVSCTPKGVAAATYFGVNVHGGISPF